MKALGICREAGIYPLFDFLPRSFRYQARLIQTFYFVIYPCLSIDSPRFELILVLFGGICGSLAA